jgi:hypothetical protein
MHAQADNFLSLSLSDHCFNLLWLAKHCHGKLAILVAAVVCFMLLQDSHLRRVVNPIHS